jgi:4-hydroxyphenylpyruvate dioxygenase
MNKNNHVGLTGFEFIEFASPNPDALHQLFLRMGFSRLKRHKTKNIDYYRQNDIHFLINKEPGSFAMSFAEAHGPCASSTCWRVKNAADAASIAVKRGAPKSDRTDYTDQHGKEMPAIKGVGDSLIYFTDNASDPDRYEKMGFVDLEKPDIVPSMGFHLVDHLTNNVFPGRLEPLAKFYKEVFGFEEVRYFDIRGKKTGLLSYALRSPCGSFCIPINEGTEHKSQINEYLREYKGEGIQHIALLTSNLINSMEKMPKEIETLDMDDEYYTDVFKRLPNVTEDHEKIKKFNLLVDGDEEGYLIQIFTQNVIGPIFFEFIQRKHHLGFGEGNFGALFRAIERDQEKRGVL